MKAKTTRRALLMSALSLLLCVSMLVGTTFAWFTDSVTSGRNTIQAGNLDVVLEYWDGDSYEEVTSTTKLFDDAALWEPGYTEVAYLKVSNAGSLALKYQLAVNVYKETDGKTKDGTSITLSDHLQFKVVESDTDLAGTYTRETAKNANATATKLQTYNSEIKPLDAKNEAGDNNYYDYVALIIYMPETVGNEANHDGVNIPSIEMGVNLLATQQTAESDSFDNQYDAGAEIYVVDESATIVNNNGRLGEEVVMTADMLYGTIKVTVPAGAWLSSAEVSSLKLTVKNAESNYSGQLAANQVATGYVIYVDGIADYINPLVDGTRKLYNSSSTAIKVELPIGAGRNDVKVYQDNNPLNGTYGDTGVVTFSTPYFTPFSQAKKSTINVVYTKLSEAEKQLNETLENVIDGESVSINSTADNMVSVNNIADALNGTSYITLVGNGADSTTVAANNATITADALTVKDMTIQATGTTTIKGNNTTIEDVDYQHAGGSYGLTVSGSNATVKDTTISGVASQALVTLDAPSSSAATISGTTIKETGTWGVGNGVTVKNLDGTVDIDDCDISVGGWALQLGNTGSAVKGTVDIANTTINSTGLTVRNVVEANFTKVTFANTWRGSSISFEIGGTKNTFTDCEFNTAINFMRCGTKNRSLTFVFDNCNVNGVAITAENVTTILNFTDVAAANTHITAIVNDTTVIIK